MHSKQFNERWLILLPYTFQFQDFTEIRVRAITNVDKVCLDEAFGWRGPHLEGLEERI